MSKDHAAPTPFRQWLVRQLLATRWAAPSGLSRAELARHLGVEESVLAEAQALRVAELARRGHTERRGRRLRGATRDDYWVVRVGLPPVILAAWKEWLATLRISSGALLRSLVHHFLLTGQRPTTLGHAWLYRGETYKASRAEHKTKAMTRITRGAQAALEHYADLWAVAPTMIVRGCIIDLLEGRVKKLKIVAYAEIWGDPRRYLEPEAFQ